MPSMDLPPPPIVIVEDLRCEGQVAPLAIEASVPRLSWKIRTLRRGWRQQACHILVASRQEFLAEERGDVWDSGRVVSSNSTGVSYGGDLVNGHRTYHWKVRVWGHDGSTSAWSQPARWEMGLLKPDEWAGHWIAAHGDRRGVETNPFAEDPAPLFRKEFEIPSAVKCARLAISGVGYYTASLNGERLPDSVLDPAWTAFDRRVLYRIYDVTTMLRSGSNCMGIMLGNGWYNPVPLKMWGRRDIRDQLAVGYLRAIAQLTIECEDGSTVTVPTDATWRTAGGPVRFNSIYLGELYDARRAHTGWDRSGYDDTAWSAAHRAESPGGSLVAQQMPPIREKERLVPVAITEPEPGVFIADMGQNLTGWIMLRARAAKENRIELRYGELLREDGSLNPMTSACGQIKDRKQKGPNPPLGSGAPPRTAWQSDSFIPRTDGEEETFRSHFSWHAFRYVEVRGLSYPLKMQDLTATRLRSDVSSAGTFSCSSERLNRIQDMCRRTFESNIMSVQSDCPHRERFGYGGDIVATARALIMNYDMAAFYAKTVRDWNDAALPSGHLTDTAPFVGIQYCGVGWEMAHPLLLRELYRFYGDRRLLEEQYDTAKRCIAAFEHEFPDGVVTKGLGDHEALAKSPTPALVTPVFAYAADTMAELAAVLGRVDDRRHFDALARKIRTAYGSRFFEPETGRCGNGSQSCQAFALFADCVPSAGRNAALALLLRELTGEEGPRLTTGIFGTRFLLNVLTQSGHAETATQLALREAFPGWGHMLENGATTLWEHWAFSDDTFSHNHPMFGSISEWFYGGLGGIRPAYDAVGFDRIIIEPQIMSPLDWVRCTHETVRGPVSCNWRRESNSVHVDLALPPNSTAEVRLPVTTGDHVIEMNEEAPRPLAQVDGLALLPGDANSLRFTLGSGTYRFILPRP